MHHLHRCRQPLFLEPINDAASTKPTNARISNSSTSPTLGIPNPNDVKQYLKFFKWYVNRGESLSVRVAKLENSKDNFSKDTVESVKTVNSEIEDL